MTITVRRTSIQDAAALARIMGDPAVYPGLMQMPYTDEDTWRARLTEGCAPGKVDLMLWVSLGLVTVTLRVRIRLAGSTWNTLVRSPSSAL